MGRVPHSACTPEPIRSSLLWRERHRTPTHSLCESLVPRPTRSSVPRWIEHPVVADTRRYQDRFEEENSMPWLLRSQKHASAVLLAVLIVTVYVVPVAGRAASRLAGAQTITGTV